MFTCAICCGDLREDPPAPPPKKKVKRNKFRPSDASCLPCGHVFHTDCLNTLFSQQNGGQWKPKKGKCPTCGKEVFTKRLYPAYIVASDNDDDEEPSSGGAGTNENAGETSESCRDLQEEINLLKNETDELRKKLAEKQEQNRLTESMMQIPPSNAANDNDEDETSSDDDSDSDADD